MSDIPNIVVEHPAGTVSFYCARSNGSTRRSSTAQGKSALAFAPAFAPGDQVRVKGTIEEQLALYGRMIAGATGTIVKPTRRSQGANRYLVHFPRHLYVTPVKRQEHPIEAHDTVLREEHLERVPSSNSQESEATA